MLLNIYGLPAPVVVISPSNNLLRYSQFHFTIQPLNQIVLQINSLCKRAN